MDIRLQTNPGLINADRMYQQQSTQTTQTSTTEEPNFLQALMDKEAELQAPQPSRETLLSLPERATLHALFGSERPDDSSFYGKNNAAQIYKGHLLDVAG